LDDVVAKTQDFLHGIGFVFEELQIQTYPESDPWENTEDIEDEDEGVSDSVYLSQADCEKIASYYSQYRVTD